MTKYIVRSCKKCRWYDIGVVDDDQAADPCNRCRRYFEDYYEEKSSNSSATQRK